MALGGTILSLECQSTKLGNVAIKCMADADMEYMQNGIFTVAGSKMAGDGTRIRENRVVGAGMKVDIVFDAVNQNTLLRIAELSADDPQTWTALCTNGVTTVLQNGYPVDSSNTANAGKSSMTLELEGETLYQIQ